MFTVKTACPFCEYDTDGTTIVWTRIQVNNPGDVNGACQGDMVVLTNAARPCCCKGI